MNRKIDIWRVFKTPEEIEHGLMGLHHIPRDAAALFVMPSCQIQSFWMKNTLVSLDMIFLDGNRMVVGYIEQAIPHDLSSHSVDKSSCYVIEAKHGFIQRNGIQVGDILYFILQKN